MKKLKIGLIGSTGRIGVELEGLIKDDSGIEITGKASSKQEIANSVFKNIDVLVDFSTPNSFRKYLKLALKHNIPFVSGTTGISSSDIILLKKCSKKIPILWSPNMSIGVNTLLMAISSLKGVSGWDFGITEFHHKLKVDKPSGTALVLKNKLEKTVDKKIDQVVSLRGGGVFGEHHVYAFGEEEVITFKHEALNRKVFAKGAIKAALWLKNKKPGLYKVEDLLK